MVNFVVDGLTLFLLAIFRIHLDYIPLIWQMIVNSLRKNIDLDSLFHYPMCTIALMRSTTFS